MSEAASSARSWPFQEARGLLKRLEKTGKAEVVFETGYGPSGLPHIGTLAEVVRTSWVRRALAELGGPPSRLIVFSDDMDGLRKAPENVPNQAMLNGRLGVPLCRVPDPFDIYESFAAHNNAMLRRFLDRFDLDYEFVTASDSYASGRFDDVLRRVLAAKDEVEAIVAPTLREERGATYSAILPIHPRTGRVMQVATTRVADDYLQWVDPETGETFATSVCCGQAKLQWKADWAMRWLALGVDYEMSGKDLSDSVKLSGRICSLLGGAPPLGFTYELFLDEEGRKISKSRGNGLSVDEWLRYGPREGLEHFLFAKPTATHQLHPGIIPRLTDEVIASAQKLPSLDGKAVLDSPAWHVLRGRPPFDLDTPVSYAMLLNLAAVSGAQEPEVLWRFLANYRPGLTPGAYPVLDEMVVGALRLWHERLSLAQQVRPATPSEWVAMLDLAGVLRELTPGMEAEAVQFHVYEVGKRHYEPADLRSWFKALYQVLLGQDEGPRFGHFAAVYGLETTAGLIEAAVARPVPAAKAAPGM